MSTVQFTCENAVCPNSGRCCSLYDQLVKERDGVPPPNSSIPDSIRNSEYWCCRGSTPFCGTTLNRCSQENLEVAPVSQQDENELRKLIIITVSCAAGLLLLAGIIFFCVRRRSKKQDKEFKREHELREVGGRPVKGGGGVMNNNIAHTSDEVARELESIRRDVAEERRMRGVPAEDGRVPRPGSGSGGVDPQRAAQQHAHQNAARMVGSGLVPKEKEDATTFDMPVDDNMASPSGRPADRVVDGGEPQLPPTEISSTLKAKSTSFREASQ